MPRLSKIGAAALAAFGWTSGSSVTATYLVVAGGGAGGGPTGGHGGGGGGAGGYRTGTASLNPSLSYTVTVGAGAAGATGTGSAGSSSTFSVTTSAGGGGGGSGTSAGTSGGSGGGGASDGTPAAGGAGNTPSTSPSQGNNGGQGITDNASYSANGGGGGAGAVGAAGVNGQSGAGGAGTANTITGSSVTYAGGGGGGQTDQSALGAGGAGGGGSGGVLSTNGNPGTANLGGGGGGSGRSASVGGSGGSGVVIISYPGAQQFGGGVVTTDGTNTIHTFTTSGTLVPATPLTAQYLIVAGGAGGGGNYHTVSTGGGGGAGGLLTGTGLTIDANSNYVVVVGAGGAGGTGGAGTNGVNGTNSTFSMVATAAVGGGYGATNQQAGGNGGSGGGASGPTTSGTFAGGTATSGQGNAGGSANQFQGAGGGGAGAVGGSGATGLGGNGLASSISGTSTYYAGGGGATTASLGGGGIDGGAGTANTGGGGGRGAGGANNAGGAGGSGVVIIAYPGATQQMAGGTVTISGGNVIHTFTSSGYLTPIKYASRSLRFRSSASAYLSRTTTASVTNNKIFTYSMWVKRGIINDPSVFETLIGGGPTNADTFGFGSGTNAAGDYLQLRDSGGGTFNLLTTQLFRDPSSWYHFVLAVDTTQATAANRVKIYLNGVQITAFSTASYPAQNYVFDWNTTSTAYVLGRRSGGNATWYFDGYMTEVNAVDGQALTPSSFGTFNSYGVWQPITYGGSYGTNGFYLTFGNNTSTTTLGYDTSPQGNNWTTNNISLTAGVTYDSMTDVPTLTSATVANYPTLSPLIGTASANYTLNDGNLKLASSAMTGHINATMAATSGKYYWECIVVSVSSNNDFSVGVDIYGTASLSASVGQSAGSYTLYSYAGNTYLQKRTNSSGTLTNTTAAVTNDIIMVAMDVGAGYVWWGKNGTWIDSGNPATGANPMYTGLTGTLIPAVNGGGGSTSTTTLSHNFGQQGFTYTPPSGFVALNTYNLSTPTIPNGAVYMAATTYAGSASTQVINSNLTSLNFAWIKDRTSARSHVLVDTVRSGSPMLTLYSDLTAAEDNSSPNYNPTSISGNSITLGGAKLGINTSGDNYVMWGWSAGSSNVTNTSGSITSTVSANTTAGFSIVTYTGTGANATVGHGLGVAPSMIIFKSRTQASVDWPVYHISTGNDGGCNLNETAAKTTTSTRFNNTTPTSTVFSVGSAAQTNGSTQSMLAYVFAAVAGYSAFGSYTGNGSADGPFVFTGFRPRFLIIKWSSGVENWYTWDSARSTYNVVGPVLYPNLSNAESASVSLDFLSNGFKIRDANNFVNSNSGTYIYMAFAENPFKYSNAR